MALSARLFVDEQVHQPDAGLASPPAIEKMPRREADNLAVDLDNASEDNGMLVTMASGKRASQIQNCRDIFTLDRAHHSPILFRRRITLRNVTADRIHHVASGRYNLRVHEVGNPSGFPLIVLHGGPGSGSDVRKAGIFDLTKYRVFFLDQRGAGLSTPAVHTETSIDALRDNTTVELIEDIRIVKEQLGIEDRWVVAGNSFGSALGLSYAIKYPDHVAALFFWAVFLCRAIDLGDMFSPSGRAATARPEAYERFLDYLAPGQRDNPLHAYMQLVWSEDRQTREDAAWEWAAWNRQLYYDQPRPEPHRSPQTMPTVMNYTRLVQYYFANNAFLPNVFGEEPDNNQLLREAHNVSDVPVRLIHGERDLATPLEGAELLHSALRNSSLAIVPNASHSSSEPGYFETLQAESAKLDPQVVVD